MENEQGNKQRAEYAFTLLEDSRHYTADETGIQDLISDIMHLCNRNEWDFQDIMRLAANNFEEELIDPECNGAAA